MTNKFYNKVKWAIKTYGPIKSIYWMVFGYFKINKFIIYSLRLTDHDFSSEQDVDLSIEFYHPNDIDFLRDNAEFNTYETFISSYLKASGCFIGYLNNRPAHIMWIFRKGDDSRLFDLKEDEAELNYCYTPEDLRGKGIYSRMIRKASGILKNQGATCLYMATHETNEAAQKAILRSGLIEIGNVKNYGVLYRPKWKG